MSEDKWKMFKNYMHNELGITKDDIRDWVKEAVVEQAERMVKKEFDNFDVHRVVEKVISDDNYFGNKSLKRDIKQELAEQIMNRLNFVDNK
jgi:hypothetical protein